MKKLIPILVVCLSLHASSTEAKGVWQSIQAKFHHHPGTAPAVCGNKVCEEGETYSTCLRDCPPPPPPTGGGCCGDNHCHLPEDGINCALDCCSVDVHHCGDGVCGCHETMVTCPQDCKQPVCGNAVCEPGEKELGCVTDCGNCPVCGDGICNGSETCSSCSADCKACPPAPPPPSTCGNGICEVSDCPGSSPERICSCPDCLCSPTWTFTQENVQARDMYARGSFLYVVGETPGDGSCRSIWLGKLDTCRGTLLWSKTFNPGGCAHGGGIAADASGNVYVTGSFDTSRMDHNKIFIRKYNSAGGAVSPFGAGIQTTYATGMDSRNIVEDIAVDSGYLYLVGWTTGAWYGSCGLGDGDILLMRYNLSGVGVGPWVAPVVVNGPGDGCDWGYGLAVAPGGHIFVTGQISPDRTSSDDLADLWVSEYSPTGSQVWQWSYSAPPLDGYPDSYDEGRGIAVTGTSGSYQIAVAGLIHGESWSYHAGSWMGLIGSPFPTLLWAGGYDSDLTTTDWAKDVAFDSLGNLIVTGNNEVTGGTDLWVRKYGLMTSGSLPFLWEATYAGTGVYDSTWATSLGVKTDSNDNIYVLGSIGTELDYPGERPTLWIRKYRPEGP